MVAGAIEVIYLSAWGLCSGQATAWTGWMPLQFRRSWKELLVYDLVVACYGPWLSRQRICF